MLHVSFLLAFIISTFMFQGESLPFRDAIPIVSIAIDILYHYIRYKGGELQEERGERTLRLILFVPPTIKRACDPSSSIICNSISQIKHH
jgi:hypothetical protein